MANLQFFLIFFPCPSSLFRPQHSQFYSWHSTFMCNVEGVLMYSIANCNLFEGISTLHISPWAVHVYRGYASLAPTVRAGTCIFVASFFCGVYIKIDYVGSLNIFLIFSVVWSLNFCWCHIYIYISIVSMSLNFNLVQFICWCKYLCLSLIWTGKTDERREGSLGKWGI